MKARLAIIGVILLVAVLYMTLAEASRRIDEQNRAAQGAPPPNSTRVTMKELVDGAKDGKIKDGTIYFENGVGVTAKIEAFRTRENKPKDEVYTEGKMLEDDSKVLRAANFKESLSQKKGPELQHNPFAVAISMLTTLVFVAFMVVALITIMRLSQRLQIGSRKKRGEKRAERFTDVAGCDEAIEEIREPVDYLRNPKKFGYAGGKMPGGIILFGPTGTGKTLLAEAMAGEADVPFFALTGSDFIEMFVGVGAARVRSLFKEARKAAPCLIFIDELDAVGSRGDAGSGSGGDDEKKRTITSILSEMDGFLGREGVIVVAATNYLDRIDSALLRPGRFDRKIAVNLPDLAGRLAILNVHKKKFKLVDGLDLNEVARITTGFSGADLANLLNEAALAAGKEQRAVTFKDIDTARDKVLWGRERPLTTGPEERRSTAVHEAGHALLQILETDSDIEVHKVTIIPRGSSMGSTLITKKRDSYNRSMEQCLETIRLFIAGQAAERELLNCICTGATGDIVEANKAARAMVYQYGMSKFGFYNGIPGKTSEPMEQEIQRIINEQTANTQAIIKNYKEAVDAIAKALNEKETLSVDEVKAIIARHPPMLAANANSLAPPGVAEEVVEGGFVDPI